MHLVYVDPGSLHSKCEEQKPIISKIIKHDQIKYNILLSTLHAQELNFLYVDLHTQSFIYNKLCAKTAFHNAVCSLKNSNRCDDTYIMSNDCLAQIFFNQPVFRLIGNKSSKVKQNKLYTNNQFDILHVKEAWKNGANYFVTYDKTLIRSNERFNDYLRDNEKPSMQIVDPLTLLKCFGIE